MNFEKLATKYCQIKYWSLNVFSFSRHKIFFQFKKLLLNLKTVLLKFKKYLSKIQIELFSHMIVAIKWCKFKWNFLENRLSFSQKRSEQFYSKKRIATQQKWFKMDNQWQVSLKCDKNTMWQSWNKRLRLLFQLDTRGSPKKKNEEVFDWNSAMH